MTGRRKLLLSVGCLLVINFFACLILWQAATTAEVNLLRHSLARWTVVSQSFGWIVLLAAAALGFRTIRGVTSSLSRTAKTALVLLAVGSLAAVWLLPPRTNRIYFDEHIYENIGQSIATTGEAMMCNEGEAENDTYRPFGTEYNKQPNGQPFYLAVFFRLFGISESTAHLAVNFAMLIGVVSVFYAAYLLFGSEMAAIFAGLLYLLTPMNLIWSATVAVEPAAAAFSALAIAAAALYAREPSAATAAFWGSAVGISVYYRPESICILLPALLIVLLFRWREIFEPRFYFGLMILAVLAGVELLHLFAVRNEGWGTTGDRFSWDSYRANILVNGPYLYLNQRFPIFFTALAVIGLLSVRRWRGLSPVFIWLVYSFGIFLFFYAGSFDYGADVRFSMISAAPLSILGGLGAATFLSVLERKLPLNGRSNLMVPFLFGAVFLTWTPFLPLIRAVGPEATDARVDIDAVRAFVKEIPIESIVLSHTPTVWLVLGKNSLQTSNATYNKLHVDNDLFRRYLGGVYFHFGAWCNYDNPVQQAFCYEIFESYYTKLIDERMWGNKHYSLYKLSLTPEAGFNPPQQPAPPKEQPPLGEAAPAATPDKSSGPAVNPAAAAASGAASDSGQNRKK